MKQTRRPLLLPIAAVAALGCLFAGRVSAQPLVATAGTVGDVCVDPMQSSCSRGILYVVNGATLDVQSTLNLWQGVANTFLRKLVVHPSGQFLYAAQSVGQSSPTSRWIDVIDLRTMTKVTTYAVTGDLATTSPDGTRLYLRTADAVQVLDSATGGVLSSIPAPSPNAVAVAPGGARIYIAGGTFPAWSIAVLDGATHAPVDTATYGVSRPDVGAWLGPQYSASGFSLDASLSPGIYTLSVYARSTETATFRQWRTVQITVQ